jgi:hypothetical protein
VLVQHRALGAFGADGIAWLGEQYDELPYEGSRSLVGGRLTFTVQVDDVVSARPHWPLQGSTPPVDPYETPEAATTVLTHDITVTTPIPDDEE